MRRVLIVDDHPVVRDGIRDLLQKAFPSIEATVSAGGPGLLEEVCGSSWALVVLDINLPGQNGLDIIRRAKVRCPNVPIIVFSLYSERQYAARALRAGAVAYISKERPPADLLKTMTAILEGKPVSKPREVLVAQPLLSDREVQVLGLLVRGLDPKEIAQELKISEKTVSTYRARLFQKLEVKNTVELVRYALDEGLVD
jgi:DNA-binding NarL/FixJ family response regulator